MIIGEKIKQLRVKNGLTQEELAARCELSKGFISQLERDLTSPSIATLMDILECLGTNIRDFFNEAVEEKVVFSAEDIFVNENKDLNNEIHWIVPTAQKHEMEPILMHLDEGGRSLDHDPHDGEEFGYVLQGSVWLHIGSKKHKVRKGETFYFKPTLNHYISNGGKTKAIVLWVCSPPTF
ncbi:helix-turn-helix domain-containing protein [Clostridium sp.]|uniref:helix-turn-helix domain-containing protein n=1 Tax=Clostridium sp. TaxID=1506 RepID=UPI002FCBB517